MKVSVRHTRSPATSANRYEGLGKGSCQVAQWRPSGRSPRSMQLPLASSTGQAVRSPTTVVVNTLITSGRSGKQVMVRNPWASHWVQ